MPRMIFYTKTGEAVLNACEREHLAHLARLIPASAWDITGLTRCEQIMRLIPRERGTEYLHTALDQVKAAHLDQHMSAISAATSGGVVAALNERIRSSIALALRATGNGVPLVVPTERPTRLRSLEVEFNTTLAAGSDILRLATKLYGWAASHTWIAERHRSWAADLIESGLDQGIYRRSRTNESVWLDTGWESVLELLRDGAGPVVLSTSTGEPFPNPELESWMPDLPSGYERKARFADWQLLNTDERWEVGMCYLRNHVPDLQLTPESLASSTFGPAVTVFDLLDPTRYEHVRAVVDDYEAKHGPWEV